MKMIVGLGNPESRFEGTPHNVGFDAIDVIYSRCGVSKTKIKKNGQVAQVEIDAEKILLVKPLTYMNSSGECVKKLVRKYKIDRNDIVVLVDDIDVRPGEAKLKSTGSVGSHNGMKSIASCIGSIEFKRLRIGVGKPASGEDLADYVLSKMPDEIAEAVLSGVKLAAEMAVDLLTKN